MIEQKLIPGRFIDFQVPRIPAPAFTPGAFVTLPPLRLKIRPSIGFWQKTSIVDEGVSLIDHRDFNWLAWLPGAISQVPLGRKDVLTGPMSGCWLVIYRTQLGGVVNVGHIGTSEVPEQTEAVREAWINFANTNPTDVIAGFNPMSDWAGDFPVRRPRDSREKIFGLITSNRELYSVFTFQQGGSSLLRIAGLQLIASASIEQVQRLRR